MDGLRPGTAPKASHFVSEKQRRDEKEPGDGPREDYSNPLTTLASYFSAINLRDYRRAFRFWDSPPSSFEQFARGFADTDRVRLLVPLRIAEANGRSFPPPFVEDAMVLERAAGSRCAAEDL